jgi:hypothetical protein
MSDVGNYLWDPAQPADPEIVMLERALESFRFTNTAPSKLRLGDAPARTTPWILGVAAAVLVVAGALAWDLLSAPDPWSVSTLAGAPRITTNRREGGTLDVGGTVETDTVSTARVAVGTVGVADVSPRSLIRVIRADDGEHRIALTRGTLHVNIWARPRFFVVETPAATAVDLGCVYSLSTDSLGAGMLGVSVGEVELATGKMTTLVVAGTAARLYPDRAGLPYPLSSTIDFLAAVRAAEEALSDSVVTVLARKATVPGTITLWHLLPRLNEAQRARVVRRIAALVPPPPDVAQDAILSGDSVAMHRWLDVLRVRWSSESTSPLRRWLIRVGLAKPVAQMELRRAIVNSSPHP